MITRINKKSKQKGKNTLIILQESTKKYKQTVKTVCGSATFCSKVLNNKKTGLKFESIAYKVCHDNCVHNYWLGGGSQGELKATWWLTWADIKTMAFQQKMLQFILCCYNILHLQTQGRQDKWSLFCAAAAQYIGGLQTHNNSGSWKNPRLTARKRRAERSEKYSAHN